MHIFLPDAQYGRKIVLLTAKIHARKTGKRMNEKQRALTILFVFITIIFPVLIYLVVDVSSGLNYQFNLLNLGVIMIFFMTLNYLILLAINKGIISKSFSIALKVIVGFVTALLAIWLLGLVPTY